MVASIISIEVKVKVKVEAGAAAVLLFEFELHALTTDPGRALDIKLAPIAPFYAKRRGGNRKKKGKLGRELEKYWRRRKS